MKPTLLEERIGYLSRIIKYGLSAKKLHSLFDELLNNRRILGVPSCEVRIPIHRYAYVSAKCRLVNNGHIEFQIYRDGVIVPVSPSFRFNVEDIANGLTISIEKLTKGFISKLEEPGIKNTDFCHSLSSRVGCPLSIRIGVLYSDCEGIIDSEMVNTVMHVLDDHSRAWNKTHLVPSIIEIYQASTSNPKGLKYDYTKTKGETVPQNPDCVAVINSQVMRLLETNGARQGSGMEFEKDFFTIPYTATFPLSLEES